MALINAKKEETYRPEQEKLQTYHRVEDVEVAHAPIAGHHVRGRVALRVAHVEPRPRGVGEHVQHVPLAFAWPPYRLLEERVGGKRGEYVTLKRRTVLGAIAPTKASTV